MTVWELMAELSQHPAGVEVQVCLLGTQYTRIEEVCLSDTMLVGICGGDARLLNDAGDECQWLSEVDPVSDE